ncbi:hypothetical protein A1OO_01125 [Enterovibrio norvegicus FF-33]|uniref:hypothetical protein n=1 Tax=Enterovibrio norvegicus TaxID=188144 RepID=UPI00031B5499|nr:hypothetical protein [Enterovibrio norvegicus]OEE69014.1 hypothetical protein A1OO_01125 [Enterovibrio norvegicus FF-33]
MNKDKGMATLAVVSGVLVMVALFAVSVASSGYGEIKKAQNLLIDAEQRAKAKAGLDCAIAVFEQLNLNPEAANFEDNFNLCEGLTRSSISLSTKPNHWVLSSSADYAESSIVIKLTGSEAAAFKTTGSLTLEGGHDWKSVKGNSHGDKLTCTAIIAGGSVTIDVGSSDGASFNTVTPECADDYSTNITSHSPAVTDKFEHDILVGKNTDGSSQMDLFKELFGVPREQYQTVITKYKPKQINTDSIGMTMCGATIKGEVDKGDNSSSVSDLIWVTGDCLLDGITHVGTDNKPVTIVIQNGIAAVNGGVDGFKGTIFQYTDSSMTGDMRLSSWGVDEDKNGHLSCAADSPTNVLCSELIRSEGMTKDSWKSLSLFFRGAFTSTGSYMVDVPGGTSIIRGSFSGGATDDPKGYFSGKPKLVKGSIHDF